MTCSINLERIEALKRPNAMIFGRGGGGGVLNRLTKEAGFTPLREVSFQGGSFGRKRFSTDLDQPLGNKFAARLNGVYENSGRLEAGPGTAVGRIALRLPGFCAGIDIANRDNRNSNPGRNFTGGTSESEVELQIVLELPAIVGRGLLGDAAKVRIGDAGRGIGGVESIAHVVGLHLQLQPIALCQREKLAERQVEVLEARA